MIKKIIIFGLPVVLLAVVLSIYYFQHDGMTKLISPKTISPNADDTGAAPEDIEIIVKANNQFALEFYSNLREKESGKNIFFSPYSIFTALSITYEGARNQTADEIGSVLHIQEEDIKRRSSLASVYNRLNSRNSKYQLNTANALWVQKEHRLLPGFTEIVERFYAGKAVNIDFQNNTEQTRKTINGWVEDNTNDKIKNLFPQGTLDELTQLVLTNAIYFKGNWVKQFEKSETRDEEFTVSQGQKIKVPMMRRTDDNSEFNYAETDNLQILEMLYEGEELSMMILLPKSDAQKSLEDSLTVENLNQWSRQFKKQRVDVYLPKFSFDSKYFLNENLKEMGMLSAFTPPSHSGGADFSGIDGKKDLYMDLVVHQAFVDVNEEGTEAAAATGISFGSKESVGPIAPIFRADHPFIFLIRERETEIIMFMGSVVAPVM